MIDTGILDKEEKLKYLFDRVHFFDSSIDDLKCQREEVLQNIASLTCPYNIGNVLVTENGLGRHGLQVSSVLPPKAPSLTNRWAVQTFAFSKAGEITKRGVWLEEGDDEVITVKE